MVILARCNACYIQQHLISMKRNLTKQQQHGFSLIEIMVAITLSLLFLVGIVQLFSNTRAVNASQAGLADLHESARFGLSVLSDNIMMADNWPSVDLGDRIKTLGNEAAIVGRGACNGAWVLDTRESIRGFTGLASLPADVGNCLDFATDYVPNSDVLVLRNAGNVLMPTAGGLPANNIYFRHVPAGVTNTGFSVAGAGGMIMTGAQINNEPLRTEADGTYFGVDYPYQISVYYLRRCDRPVSVNTACGSAGNESDTPTLVRLSLQGNQLVEESVATGIEQIRYRYGIDQNEDSTIDQYVTADEINTNPALQWDQVRSVQIDTIIRSPANSLLQNDTTSYSMISGPPFVPAGRAVRFDRQQIQTTVYIRNRYEIYP